MSQPPSSTHNETATAVFYAEQANHLLEAARTCTCLVTRLDTLGHAYWNMMQSAAEFDLSASRIEAFALNGDRDCITDLRAQADDARQQANLILDEITALKEPNNAS